jgi:hypothetical protein
LANLYINEYAGAGESHSSTIPALKGFVKNMTVALSSTHAETTNDISSKTTILHIKNDGTSTCYYKLGSAAALAAAPATTSDRALMAGEVEDLYVVDDIRAGNVRISAVTA